MAPFRTLADFLGFLVKLLGIEAFFLPPTAPAINEAAPMMIGNTMVRFLSFR
jgi:hypothetical protein